jgi:hypothetical protein
MCQVEDATPGLQITVYNDNLAVVKDRRAMSLPEGVGKVEFTDVAKRIDATSVHFESLSDPEGTSVIEQNYEYDLVSPTKLLDKYLDREVDIYTEEGNVLSGKLLSQAEGKITLQNAEGGLQVVSGGENITRVEVGQLPEGLITRPTLVWLTDSQTGGEQLCQVTYMTEGIGWKADYVMVVGEDEKTLNLTGWVTLDNQSGATYENAKLKLVAGDVNRVQPEVMMDSRGGKLAQTMRFEAAAAPQFEEKSFFEYHLYTLQRPTTIRESQTKQVSLLAAAEVPATKTFVYNGSQMGEKVEVKMEFRNSEKNNMGMPLPKGKIRAFKTDPADDSLEFLGEDTIDHTPRNEKLRVLLGNAFDIVGERVQMEYREISQQVYEEDWKITLRNRKEEAVTIKVVEPVWGDWNLKNSSHEATKKEANTLEFAVPVGADEVVELTYTLRVRR